MIRVTAKVERCRIQVPPRVSSYGDRYGCFLLPPSPLHKIMIPLRCIASDGSDWDKLITLGIIAEGTPAWEHVSVSPQPGAADRCPTWEEMCYVRELFWEPEDRVVQYHPPESEYVNNARNCLHLWRPIGVEFPHPPSLCVGIKGR